MRAAVKVGKERFELQEFPIPEIGPGECLIRVHACGICAWCYSVWLEDAISSNLPPGLSGHEVSGVVEQVGPGVTGWKPGDRVVIHDLKGCGECAYCREGKETYCRKARGVNRGYADYLAISSDCLLPAPEWMDLALASLLTDMVGTPMHAIRRAFAVNISRTVSVVWGLGPIGMFTVQGLLDEEAEKTVQSSGRIVESSEFTVQDETPSQLQSSGRDDVLTLNSELSTPNSPLEGRVTFESVTFGYRENEPVLRDLSLNIDAGEVIGILGPTGGGKSALVALVPRLYDPQQGRVLIDGKDVRDSDLTVLRQQVGVVFQEPFLFSGTIRENIAFGKPEATLDEIRIAAHQAAIDDFIDGLEKGYDTVIGERGLNLSGGQQQRMTIARTLLVDPRILILDDATSSVDADTEFHIQEALSQLIRNRTSFIIAQRASSVWNADRIIVLDQGRIIEQGTPGELSAIEGGHYRRLLDVQRALSGAR